MIIRTLLLLMTLIFLGIVFLRKKQNQRLNWAIFYSFLYMLVSLPLFNLLCIKFGFWKFAEQCDDISNMPTDLFFIWLVIWSVIPVLLFKGQHIFIISLVLFWLDLLLMPLAEEMKILVLKDNWILGELILIVFVFMPSYFWSFSSYYRKYRKVRALLQVITVSLFFLIGFPLILNSYGLIENLDYRWNFIEIQILLIISFPGLMAVIDLEQIGQGTPFPYDLTKNLVNSGVYAYCRNPIQWSFTLMFIPLSIHHSSAILLIGIPVSLAYSIGVSDFQEYTDMENRFGAIWTNYKNQVPKWRFLWKADHMAKAKVYFDSECIQCSQIQTWFKKSSAINLEILTAKDFKKHQLLQMTYTDSQGNEYCSVEALARSLEHINLAYASLGWFMRFPIIKQILQLIINTFRVDKKEVCNTL